MAELFTNFGLSSLASPITTGATSLTVATGEGALFPALSGSDFFRCVLVRKSPLAHEVVLVTARSTDVFTITREQEGTTALALSASDIVRLASTAATFASIVLDSDLQSNAATYFVDSGTANAYVITPSPVITAYASGQGVSFKVSNTNTGACTINVNGLGAQTILKHGVAISSGDLVAGRVYEVIHDGTNFQLQSPTPPASGNDPQAITSTDAGSASGPVFDYYRNSTSPAALDKLAELDFNGEDSDGNKHLYGSIRGEIVSPVNGSEIGKAVIDFPILDILSADAGGAAGPIIDPYRNSASPAAADKLAEFQFNGKDSAGNKQLYAAIRGEITDPTSTTESGKLVFEVVSAGSQIATASVEEGFYELGNKLSLVHIESATASNSSVVEFTYGYGIGFFKHIYLFSDVIPVTNLANFLLQTSADGGANWDTVSADYAYVLSGRNYANAFAGSDDPAAAHILIGLAVQNTANSGISGEVNIFNPSSASVCDVYYSGGGNTSATKQWVGSGLRNTAANVDGVRFLMSTGNFSGEIRHYALIES